MSRPPDDRGRNPAVRVAVAVVGGLLVAVGVALLILPGPGLLLVLAGVWVLARQFPAADRYLGPVRRQAMHAAEQSVATRARITLSVVTGVALLVAGVVWGVVPSLPFGGWPTGSSLILSGVLLLALLVYSYRRSAPRRAARVR